MGCREGWGMIVLVLVLVLGAVAGCRVGLYVGFHPIWLAMLGMDFGEEKGQAVAKGRFQIFEIHLPTFLQASNETRSILKNFNFLLSLAFLMNSSEMLNRSCSSKYLL